MELVIDIPEQMYLNAKKDMLSGSETLVSAIKNGVPLPKSHGDLKDVDEILESLGSEDEDIYVKEILFNASIIIKGQTE